MGQNFLAADREQGFLLPPNVRAWLPEDHFAWFVIEAVAEMDLAAFYGAYREDGHGRAAFDPAVMVAVLLYAYARGDPVVASDRARVRGGCRVSRPGRQPGPGPHHYRAVSPEPPGCAGRRLGAVLAPCAD